MDAPKPSAGGPFTRRLALRVGGALCLGATAVLAAAAWWNVGLQREHMTGVLTTSAVHSADLVRYATRDAMLENRRDSLRRLLAELSESPDIECIRIFDKTGRVHYSTRPEEVGRKVDHQAEQCVVCHRADWTLDVLSPERRVRQFRNGERQVLAVTTPIPNEPACSAAPCHVHAPERKVLGVLDVQMDLAPVEHHVAASERQMALGLSITTLALVALSAWILWRLVISRVQRLTAVTRRVAAGDLTARAPVTSRDEIGEFTQTWNDTVAELEVAREALDELVATLELRIAEKTRELTEAHEQMLEVEKMASLGKLAAVVAHEVNNPLAGIATYARLLRRRAARAAGADPGDDARDETMRILELVESEAARCGEIVRNLLLFSRTPGRHFAAADLRTLLERCALLFHHQADLSEVSVTLDIAADLPVIVCDASQIQQLILALSMNAIEAMGSGGRLVLSAAPGVDDTVVLSVTDSGPGIAECDLPHVFEPFYTTKPEGKGVGLGLAVVYGIARRHGGTVGVTSREGEGTTFTVRLPRNPPQPAPGGPQLLEGVIS